MIRDDQPDAREGQAGRRGDAERFVIGAKPPLRPKHVWSIRTRLMVEGRTRDLAMFNLAIDSKLRGCDVMALKVEDVAPNGYTKIGRASCRERVLRLV